ncbi:MAG: hypothetical protein OEV66_11540 [Spirochaetia bacterium]|nr:hypothetical protein [Spirochaetia bacterium]
MKVSGNECRFGLLEKIVNGNDESETLNHVAECPSCLNQLFNIDRSFWLQKRNLRSKLSIIDDESSLSEIVENIISGTGNPEIKSIEHVYQIVDFLSMLISYDQSENLKTPDFLKKIVSSEIQDNSNKFEEKIIIKISEGLNVLGSLVKNLFIISGNLEPATVRSSNSKTETTGSDSLNFYQIGDKKEKITYHIVKDSPKSILLTVNLENFENMPEFGNIRKDNRIILSQPLKGNFVYFPKLDSGNYTLELKYQIETKSICIPISVV